jgi:NAD-dependent DNA ligase
MNNIINNISKYSDIELQNYFNTELLETLHEIKLYADDKYYNTSDSSGFTDEQYDMLKETLLKRDPTYVVPIGAKIRKGENRVDLPFWLGSMNKYKPEDARELAQWIVKNRNTNYIIEDKLDGISCLIIFKNGKIKLYTRGDGNKGADISYLVQYFNTIPKNLTENIAVRGEMIMKKEIFNTKFRNKYANPRNMVAGRLGGKTIREGLTDIDFIAYEIVDNTLMPNPFEQLKYLKKIGFNVVRYELINNITIETLIEILVRFKNTSAYEIDGIIVQSNKSYQRNISGNPEYAFAFKMRLGTNLLETNVLEVEWNISKWGQLKPRVKIEPVSLGGVTINYTTGFNAKYIYDNNIGKGAVIKITRSGDVIPYIVEVIKQATEPDMPSDIFYKWNNTGVDIYTEEYGDVMCIKLISSFFKSLGIKHVNEATVKKMYDNGFNSLLKIIAATKVELKNIDSFGDRLAERTYTNIHEGLQNISISVVLGASGVFGFGLGKKKIDTLMISIPNILTLYKNITSEELLERIMMVEGFSDKSAQKIVDNIIWADKLIESLKNFATFKNTNQLSNNLNGMKFVFSGFRDKKLEENVVERGGKITTTVSRNTTGLIVLDKKENTEKIKKAKDLGIEIYTKEEFKSKYIDI